MKTLLLKRETGWRVAFASLLFLSGILTSAFMVNGGSLVPCKVHAATYPTSEFCYATNISIRNSGGALANALVVTRNSAGTTGINSSLLISNQYMSAYADDVLIVDTSATDRQVMTQDLNSAAAHWWILVPSIPAASTINLTMYTGSYRAHRNNAISMNGNAGTYISRAHNAAFNVTDDFDMSFYLDTDGTTFSNTSPAWLVSHYNTGASTGYRAGTVDIAGVKYIRAQVDGATPCDTPWGGNNTQVDAVFQHPNLKIYFDGTLQKTCNTGLASVSTNTSLFESGITAASTGGYTGTLHSVKLISSYSTSQTIVLNWGMAAKNKNGNTLTETQAASSGNSWTAIGTITDVSGNGYDGTYQIVASQANLTVTVGNTYSNQNNSGAIIGQSFNNVLPNPLSTAQAAQFLATPLPSAGNNLPLQIGQNINLIAADEGGTPMATWYFGFGIAAVLSMAGVAFISKSPAIGLAMPCIVFLFGAFMGPLSPWIALIAGLVGFGMWGLQKVGQF